MITITELDLTNAPIDDAARVAEYLDACPILIVAAGLDPDPLLSGSPAVVSIGVASDGTYTWPLSVSYHARAHGIAPDVELLAHIRSQQHVPPKVSPTDVDRLREELASISAETPTDVATTSGVETSGTKWQLPTDPWGDGSPS
jgi:hypothetical protein